MTLFEHNMIATVFSILVGKFLVEIVAALIEGFRK
jgi:hypothetical protein